MAKVKNCGGSERARVKNCKWGTSQQKNRNLPLIRTDDTDLHHYPKLRELKDDLVNANRGD